MGDHEEITQGAGVVAGMARDNPISLDEFEQFFFNLVAERWPHLLEIDSVAEQHN